MGSLGGACRGPRHEICHRALHEHFFAVPFVSDIVVLVHNQNPGIAFGVFSDSSSRWLAPLLLLSSVAVMVLLVWMIVTGRAGGALAQCGLALILGGAAGNALDRVIHGGVTDFLEVRLWTYIWPAFNVADSAINDWSGAGAHRTAV